jgi:murein DD-endopeptidase MepM/ murein hydrolase activator NlpD
MAAPYFFADINGNPIGQSPAAYLIRGRTYHFPTGHRLAGNQSLAKMDIMWRDLLRLFVRCDYDFNDFKSFLSHGIQELVLPHTSVHVKMTGGWLYSNGSIHNGIDFNDEPQRLYPYPDHINRTNFEVVAAAEGTIVGWDETKLLTLEHVSNGGQLYRTIYNMMRNVPVATVTPGSVVVELGRQVAAGQVIGEVYDPPDNVIHLHFGMALPHTVPSGWMPDLTLLFNELSAQFSITFTNDQQRQILNNWSSSRSWPRTEWFFIDPFGLYGISRQLDADYGPVGRGFYYPVPTGVGTYAFRDAAIGGDPGGNRIPLFAAEQKLLDNLSILPISMATLSAACE